MYKRHKIMIFALFVVVFIVTFLIRADYSKIAESAISIVSIALAVYIGATSVLLGSNFAENLKNQRDSQINTKTRLGVLATYLRVAGYCSVATIIISGIYTLDLDLQFVDKLFVQWEHGNCLLEIIYLMLSSFSCSMFTINILFISFLLLFLINSMAKSV